MAFKKDPNATLDYQFNWAEYLTPITDSILSVAWTLSAGLTQVSQSFTTTTATIFVSGGVLDEVETIACKITTSGGRIDERTISLSIVNR
jgi:hypothetical protein